jgi:hypothetical protein
VILDDVANRAGLVVELAPPGDAELLGHRDLYRINVMPVPDRFEKGVGEPEIQQVVDGFFSEIVVDPENRRLRQHAADRVVQRPRGRQVVSERLLDDHPSIGKAPGFIQLRGDLVEQHRRYSEVMSRSRGAAERRADRGERRGIGEVAVHVTQQRDEPRERGLVDATIGVRLQAGSHPVPELFDRPARAGHADDRNGQVSVLHHALQRRKDLFVGKIAGRAKEDERVGGRHRGHMRAVSCAKWTPGRMVIHRACLGVSDRGPRNPAVRLRHAVGCSKSRETLRLVIE